MHADCGAASNCDTPFPYSSFARSAEDWPLDNLDQAAVSLVTCRRFRLRSACHRLLKLLVEPTLRTGIEGDGEPHGHLRLMPAWPLRMLYSVLRLIPRDRAASVTIKFRGSRQGEGGKAARCSGEQKSALRLRDGAAEFPRCFNPFLNSVFEMVAKRTCPDSSANGRVLE